jgi:hypothetical protein
MRRQLATTARLVRDPNAPARLRAEFRAAGARRRGNAGGFEPPPLKKAEPMIGAVACPYFRRAFGWCVPIARRSDRLGGGEFRCRC